METRDPWLKWTPRVLGILYAVFISLFAFDVWEMEGSLWARFGGFLIHLVPTYLVVIALLVAWWRPSAGGVLFLALAAAFSLFFGWREPGALLPLALPLVVTGVLFIADWWVMRGRLQLKT